MKDVYESEFSGIINLGDHLVVLYRDSNEITETVISYISNCLKNNIKFMYINGGTDANTIIESLKFNGLYYDYIESKQLLFLEKEDAYSKGGKFHPDKMKNLLIQLSKEAKEEGYDGLGISGEISWVLDYTDGFDLIYEYEWKLNSEVFDNYPVTALCRYNMDKFTDDMIINIIQLHPYLIIKNVVHENPFFIPAVAYEENKISKYQVQTMLENIVSFTNTKSDFNKKIVEKEKEYEILENELITDIIYSMIGLLELHNKYTTNHSENVALTSRRLAENLGLSKKVQSIVFFSALIHDIGKIKVPTETLDKPDKLTNEEYDIIKKHPEWGAKALRNSGKLKEISDYVLHHHERIDGKGYPDGLKGEEIPLISRIIAICDAYDAMTSERPYREAYSKDYAIKELTKCKNTQFNSQLVDVFVNKVIHLMNSKD
ncbi:MAG: MEDS domain-containing protein [Tenericutes bacterium]|nr:MEDS domain-containing protein [Mycoplasmatota bacterium]